jgi:Heterokaryon incompatibility protein (HET)
VLLLFAISLADRYCKDDPAAWHGGINGRPLPRTAANSEEDFQLAWKWLKDCLNNHTKCPNGAIEAPLPTGSIDVGPPDGSTDPYLLDSDGRKGTYITLSHCWGGMVPLTTTTVTLEERKRSIPLTSLPRTFREAVIITRRFGIRYLWIDSLCILQDSPTDWENESAVMEDIYSFGFINIAARGALNAEGGCFMPREAEPPPCLLKYSSSDCSLTGSMYIRSPAFETERLQDAPLDKRGWVLQERLLSPRILYFGRQQLYWECAETTLRQDGKHCDVSTDALRLDLDFKASVIFDTAFRFSSGRPHAQIDQQSEQAEVTVRNLMQWYKVVRQYTRRNLTFHSDKLPAISGIAKVFQAKTGCAYIAGIWKEDLIAGIAWYLKQPSHEIISMALPSWSWARLEGEVSFRSLSTAEAKMQYSSCQLVSVTHRPAGGLNPYGDIADATLKVQGRLIQVRYKPPESSDDTFRFETSIFALDGRPIGRASFDTWASYPDSVAVFFCFLLYSDDYRAAALALELEKDHHEARCGGRGRSRLTRGCGRCKHLRKREGVDLTSDGTFCLVAPGATRVLRTANIGTVGRFASNWVRVAEACRGCVCVAISSTGHMASVGGLYSVSARWRTTYLDTQQKPMSRSTEHLG